MVRAAMEFGADLRWRDSLSSRLARRKTDSRVCAGNVWLWGCSQSRHPDAACNDSLTKEVERSGSSDNKSPNPRGRKSMFTRTKICTALLPPSPPMPGPRTPPTRPARRDHRLVHPPHRSRRRAADHRHLAGRHRQDRRRVGHRTDPEAAGDDRRQLPAVLAARSTATATAPPRRPSTPSTRSTRWCCSMAAASRRSAASVPSVGDGAVNLAEPAARRDRARRSADRRRLGAVRLRRHRRRGQLHHQEEHDRRRRLRQRQPPDARPAAASGAPASARASATWTRTATTCSCPTATTCRTS